MRYFMEGSYKHLNHLLNFREAQLPNAVQADVPFTFYLILP